MSWDTAAAADHLSNHPKLTGVLFMALLLLSQVGDAAAAAGSTLGGP